MALKFLGYYGVLLDAPESSELSYFVPVMFAERLVMFHFLIYCPELAGAFTAISHSFYFSCLWSSHENVTVRSSDVLQP